ncbi:MAG: hypothetical protein K0R78_111 [Pelosinus sp.]|jgi:hypothetical protein|nr:hypothetical protein [Pelosinus sp.]
MWLLHLLVNVNEIQQSNPSYRIALLDFFIVSECISFSEREQEKKG